MFDFDSGSDGAKGPFINWHANGRKDGTANAKTFSLKDGDERKDITDNFTKGVVFDIDALKTGWSLFSIGGTEWKWNDTVSRMAQRPGEEWKKGISVPIAITKDTKGVWVQSGAGTFMAFSDLAKQLRDRDGAKLPMVKMSGVNDVEFNGGGSTCCAKLDVMKWVDRPECLDEQQAQAIDVSDDEEF